MLPHRAGTTCPWPARKSQDHTAPLWVESGDARDAPLVTVAPLAPLDRVYTYTADEALARRLCIGQRVSVPFGRKSTLRPAIVVELTRGPWTSSLRPVAEALDDAGELSPHLLELGRWIARYYAAPLGRTLAAMIPEAVRRQRGFERVRRTELIADRDQLADARFGAKQAAIVEHLKTAGTSVETGALLAATGASRATLRSLIKSGAIHEAVEKHAPEDDALPQQVVDPDFALTDAQQSALARVDDALTAQTFRGILLFGVSGSGKTEIYIRAMRAVAAAGRQAIMLVPEIALTTQLVQRLAVRFERVAVIHSGLSDVERSRTWENVRTGKTPIVIGTRSAVFAPCPDLGLIVVDEEQEPSYKNLQSPRFHVRDVAIKRAHLLDIPIVLGSATPSLETWHNAAHAPTYERLDLPRRVRALPLPQVRLVDMRDAGRVVGPTGISPQLNRALADTLAADRQAVILINRRGFASWLFCSECGRRVQCPRCQASMVLHRLRGRMLCHHCHASEPIPTRCADVSCGGPLQPGGGGTERIEQQLRADFPSARIHRADSDTMNHARKYQALVDAFAAGEIDVLLGTQMIAKGLDFPSVSLVGVIGADLAAAGADFRSAERLFQLVTQVAGRAGRAEADGLVVVQTQDPTSAALRFAAQHDYTGFAAAELPQRRTFGFPPYTRLTRFVLAGASDAHTHAQAEALAERLRVLIAEQAEEPGAWQKSESPRPISGSPASAARASVLGAHPCAIERIRNRYRHEVLLRTIDAKTMRTILDRARKTGALKTSKASLIIDVDPIALS
jgi:primosomal protein N' (replication factor Y)